LTAAVQGIEPTVNVDNEVIVPEDAIQVEVIGVQGPPGDQGPAGELRFYTIVKASTEVLFDGTIRAATTCDKGDIVTGGGFISGDAILVKKSFDSGGTSGWEAEGVKIQDGNEFLSVRATCLDNEPFRTITQ